MLGVEPHAASSKSPQERHQLALTKLNQAINKMSRTISPGESSMPQLKRRSSPHDFDMFKDGLIFGRASHFTHRDC